MYYLKTLLTNFLTVFFADYILPGIQVVSQSKIPHLNGDLIFPLILAFLNSLIVPVLRLVHQEATPLRIGMICLILNFGAYGLVKLLPFGIAVHSVEGYIFSSTAVSIGSFLTNYFEAKRYNSCNKADPLQ